MPPPFLHRHRDAVTGALLSLGSAVFLYPFVRVLWRIGDEGTLVHNAQRVVEGALPYRDFFDVMGPGSFYWLGLFFKLFGTQWLVARGVLLLTGVATALLMYRLARRLDPGPGALLPGLFYLAVSIPLWPGTNHHWDSNLFALLAAAAFCLWQDRGRKVFLLLAGVAAGITSCFIQQKGLFLFLGLAAAAFFTCRQAQDGWRQTCADLARLTLGYAGAGAAVILYFYAAGGLNDLVYANLIWPLSNYHKVNVVPYGYSLWELFQPQFAAVCSHLSPPPWARTLTILSMAPLYLILALPGLMIFLILGNSFSRAGRDRLLNSRMLSCIILGAALWLSEIHRKDIMHLVYGSPLLLIVCFSLLKQGLVEKNKMAHGFVVGILGLGLFSLAAVNLVLANSAKEEMVTRVGKIYCFQQDEALEFLLKNTSPGEPVFIYPYYPMYYFLAGVSNPTRYSILMYQTNTEDQFKEVIEDLEKARVKYVLWDTLVSGGNLSIWFPQYRNPPEDELILENYFLAHYDAVTEKNKFRILRRREN
jgi:hypothetical protein